MDKHPLYGAIALGHGDGDGDGDDPTHPPRIPQVYIDVAKLITDILVYRYVGQSEAEQLFDAIVCGLEACDVHQFDAELIRAQLMDTIDRGNQ